MLELEKLQEKHLAENQKRSNVEKELKVIFNNNYFFSFYI